MKNLLPAAALLCFSPFVAATWTAQGGHELPVKQDPAKQDASAQAGAQSNEARLVALETEVATLKKQNEELHTLLDQTVTYLDKQSKAAQALLGTLTESEQQGFAVGENWNSRVTLLAGFRAYWGEAQNGLPKLPAPPPPAKPSAPARAVRAPAKPQ